MVVLVAGLIWVQGVVNPMELIWLVHFHHFRDVQDMVNYTQLRCIRRQEQSEIKRKYLFFKLFFFHNFRDDDSLRTLNIFYLSFY